MNTIISITNRRCVNSWEEETRVDFPKGVLGFASRTTDFTMAYNGTPPAVMLVKLRTTIGIQVHICVSMSQIKLSSS
jgi:hypothetical protein